MRCGELSTFGRPNCRVPAAKGGQFATFAARVSRDGISEFRFPAAGLPMSPANVPEGRCGRGLGMRTKAGAADGVLAAQTPNKARPATTKRAKWLVLGSGKGGSGKTTTALNLAA